MDSQKSKLVYRLFAAAKSILEVGAYKMDDVLMYREELTPDEISLIESAQIDLMEAFNKIEGVIKNRI